MDKSSLINANIINRTMSLQKQESNDEFHSWIDFLSTMTGLGQNSFTYEKTSKFFHHNWHVSIYFSLIYYIIIVQIGPKWMQNRNAFNLRLPLALWSGFLSLFSLIGTIYTWPEFINIIINHGFVETYCNDSFINDKTLVYWYTVFSLSKLIELIDTVFIVLRKQRLITLHWLHHIMTLVFTFYVAGYRSSTARWMVTMNLAVHAIMYGYYSARALKFSLPKFLAMFITSIQILQMIFGLFIHGHILWLKLQPQNSTYQCINSFNGVLYGFIMYLIYFYFFVQLFYDSYLKPKQTYKSCAIKDINNNNQNEAKKLK